MLFEEIVYGPIHSRRLGISLGVNLMPQHNKLCSFDCLYCECGFNTPVSHPILPSVEQVEDALDKQLSTMSRKGEVLDVITFSGNGEPTLHPHFEQIMEITIRLRTKYYPQARVVVLSNSTQLGRADVVRGLRLADERVLKLDSAINATMQRIDQPLSNQFSVEQLLLWLGEWNGDFTLQTCFLKGINDTVEEVEAWYKAVERLHPSRIMIYVIDRPTPDKSLQKVTPERMQAIAAPLREKGYEVVVSC